MGCFGSAHDWDCLCGSFESLGKVPVHRGLRSDQLLHKGESLAGRVEERYGARGESRIWPHHSGTTEISLESCWSLVCLTSGSFVASGSPAALGLGKHLVDLGAARALVRASCAGRGAGRTWGVDSFWRGRPTSSGGDQTEVECGPVIIHVNEAQAIGRVIGDLPAELVTRSSSSTTTRQTDT
jgi:hypothetical protein